MKNINKLLISSLAIALTLPNSVNALTKDETVYSTINSDGSLFKTTVVNHLYNANDDETKDMTELKEILNVNGNETFNISGTNITWNNKGKEIFYQGKIEKELPITTEIKYYLDGKEYKSKDLIGKKGKVKVVINFKNNDKHITKVNGYEETIYTPFVVTLGTVLNNKNASNIEVTNGKIVNTGSKNFIIALSSPGLYESLGVDKFKDMDSITITYDTNEYKETSMYLVSTPKLIDNTDLKVFDKLNKVYNDVNKLNTNMDTIENGAKELETGANKLASGSKQISDNLKTIVDYMKQLENGTLELDTGLKQLISALQEASNEITSGNTEESINSLNTLKQGNNSAISELSTTNTTIKETLANHNINIDEVTTEQLQQVNESLATYKKTYDGNNKLIYLLTQNNNVIDQTIKTSTETSAKISNLISILQDNLSKIESGSNSIYNNTSKLRSGIEELYQGSVTLTNGANSLYDGTTTLRSGISTYNSEGIKVLSTYTNKARTYTNKLEALTKLTDEYKGFASNNTNTTTFVSVIK